MKVKNLIISCVHHQHLYITTRLQDYSCVMYRTNDLVEWDKIPTPRDANVCDGLASHAQSDCLFGLWTTTNQADQGRLILHRFDGKVWQRMPNARTPQKRWEPAVFCLKNSLILAGGHDGRNSMKTVQEFSFTGQKWLSDSKWPFLPKAVATMCPVLTSSAVHLIGGSTLCEGVLSENHSVLTMSVDRHKPAGEWLTDVLPDTPVLAGAQNALECPTICDDGEKGQRLSKVSLFDVEEKQWLSLPPLLQPRSNVTVQYFQNSLIAFGGNTGSEWSSSTEFLPDFAPSTWLEWTCYAHTDFPAFQLLINFVLLFDFEFSNRNFRFASLNVCLLFVRWPGWASMCVLGVELNSSLWKGKIIGLDKFRGSKFELDCR